MVRKKVWGGWPYLCITCGIILFSYYSNFIVETKRELIMMLIGVLSAMFTAVGISLFPSKEEK